MLRRERIRRWVDGELDAREEEALLDAAERDPELAALLEEAMEVRSALEALSVPPVPADLVDTSVLRAVREKNAHDEARANAHPLVRMWWSLTRPRTVRVRLVTLFGLALSVTAVVGAGLYGSEASEGTAGRAQATRDESARETVERAVDEATVAVRLMLPAEGAQSVAVAGDFNDWNPESLYLEDPEGDGVFVGTVRVSPGSYGYMFVVDGERWITDPYAANHVDDGFGNRNAVLRID